MNEKTFPYGEQPSKSYPYLWASRKIGANYGDVLHYVGNCLTGTCSESYLSQWQREFVTHVWIIEMERRLALLEAQR